MKKILFSAVLLAAVACSEPETEAPDTGNESAPEASAPQPETDQPETASDGGASAAVEPEDVPTELPAFPSGKPVFELSADQAAALLAEDTDVVVLDIRTPEEFEQGNIPGAINIDYRSDDFRSKIEELDRSTHYLVHCASGGRSGSSLQTFQDLGFSRIYHLTNGYNAWSQETQNDAP